MAARKKTGRSAAEKAYAKLQADNTALVGNVGEHYEKLRVLLDAATAEAERYEDARSQATKAGALTKAQFDQLGYESAPRIPVLPEIGEDSAEPAAAKKKPAGSGGAPAKAAPAENSEEESSDPAAQQVDQHAGREPVPAG